MRVSVFALASLALLHCETTIPSPPSPATPITSAPVGSSSGSSSGTSSGDGGASAGGASGGSSGDTSGSSAGDGSSSGSGSSSGNGSSSGDGATSSGGGNTTGAGRPKHTTGAFKVLFDGAHKQVAGNADWVLDSHATLPADATSWNGGISTWGTALMATGRYAVSQLSSGTLNFGQGGAGDLSQYDLFISDEPELSFSSTESMALTTFAQSGGGLFLISDHNGAARCGTCIQAWQVLNTLLNDSKGLGGTLGVTFDGNDIASGGESATTSLALFANGLYGAGTTLVYHSGSTVSATSATNALAQIAYTGKEGGYAAISALADGGRVVIIGDSSPEEDGSGSTSAKLYDGWHEGSDGAVLLNLTAWAVGESN